MRASASFHSAFCYAELSKSDFEYVLKIWESKALIFKRHYSGKRRALCIFNQLRKRQTDREAFMDFLTNDPSI